MSAMLSTSQRARLLRCTALLCKVLLYTQHLVAIDPNTISSSSATVASKGGGSTTSVSSNSFLPPLLKSTSPIVRTSSTGQPAKRYIVALSEASITPPGQDAHAFVTSALPSFNVSNMVHTFSFPSAQLSVDSASMRPSLHGFTAWLTDSEVDELRRHERRNIRYIEEDGEVGIGQIYRRVPVGSWAEVMTFQNPYYTSMAFDYRPTQPQYYRFERRLINTQRNYNPQVLDQYDAVNGNAAAGSAEGGVWRKQASVANWQRSSQLKPNAQQSSNETATQFNTTATAAANNNATTVVPSFDASATGSAEELTGNVTQQQQQQQSQGFSLHIRPQPSQFATPFWNLDRIDQYDLPLDGLYNHQAVGSGEGVNIYLIDTGCRTTHQEFEGRAELVYTIFKDGVEDHHGHGTHTAGIAGGRSTGVAPKVNLKCMAVLDSRGSGTYSDVIAAMNWLVENAEFPAVLSQSFGGSFSRAANDAVQQVMNKGIISVVAAGNTGQPMCSGPTAVSPACANGVISVASFGKDDNFSAFSNYGSCIAMSAPGEDVVSSWGVGDSDALYGKLSGTSMSTPAIAGAAALYLANYPGASQAEVRAALQCSASAAKLKNQPADTDAAILNINLALCDAPVQSMSSQRLRKLDNDTRAVSQSTNSSDLQSSRANDNADNSTPVVSQGDFNSYADQSSAASTDLNSNNANMMPEAVDMTLINQPNDQSLTPPIDQSSMHTSTAAASAGAITSADSTITDSSTMSSVQHLAPSDGTPQSTDLISSLAPRLFSVPSFGSNLNDPNKQMVKSPVDDENFQKATKEMQTVGHLIQAVFNGQTSQTPSEQTPTSPHLP